MRFFLIVIFFLSIKSSHAFYWERCDDSWIRPTYGAGVVISTTQFVSLWGDCSYIKQSEDADRQNFVSKFYDQIKIDASKGEGESLATLADLYGCHNKNKFLFFKLMQFNYENIFDYSELEYKKILKTIDKLISIDEFLYKNCKLIIKYEEPKHTTSKKK